MCKGCRCGKAATEGSFLALTLTIPSTKVAALSCLRRLTRLVAYPYGDRSSCFYISGQKRQRSKKLKAMQHLHPGKMRCPIRVAEISLIDKSRPREGGQGTMGPLRRFFPTFLSAGGKKGGRRRLDTPSAQQGVRERKRREFSPTYTKKDGSRPMSLR